MAGLLNTQIGSQSAPSTSEANADLARRAFESVRGRVNANLLNLFMGLGRGVEANMGNPPMLRGQLPEILDRVLLFIHQKRKEE